MIATTHSYEENPVFYVKPIADPSSAILGDLRLTIGPSTIYMTLGEAKTLATQILDSISGILDAPAEEKEGEA